MRRGDVYLARLDPVEDSEQAGTRPVIIVSRDAINVASPVVIVVPCTAFSRDRRVYPSHVVLKAPEGGLKKDSIALGEQLRAISKTRLQARWGTVSGEVCALIDRALLIALDLGS